MNVGIPGLGLGRAIEASQRFLGNPREACGDAGPVILLRGLGSRGRGEGQQDQRQRRTRRLHPPGLRIRRATRATSSSRMKGLVR